MQSLFGDSVPQSPPRSKKPEDEIKRRLTIMAANICAAAWKVISEEHDMPLTKSKWTQRNMRPARDLAEAGRTPVEVADMLLRAYAYESRGTRWYANITDLNKLIDKWPMIAKIEPEEGPPLEVYDPDSDKDIANL